MSAAIWICPLGGCEVGAIAVTVGDRTSRAAAPSFRADRRLRAVRLRTAGPASEMQIAQFWTARTLSRNRP